MANILTAAEAANVLRCEVDDARMLALLPQIDQHIQTATGHAWEDDNPINETAKAAARMLLVRWFEDPGMMVGGQARSLGGQVLSYGVRACLAQLEALARRYRTFQGRSGAGPIDLSGAYIGDSVETLVGVSGVNGDRSADFESIITVNGQIQQESSEDLSNNWYRVHLIPVEDQ
jgi:hypothetical protein